jgi:DNA-binding MarR family transcriptional regulator
MTASLIRYGIITLVERSPSRAEIVVRLAKVVELALADLGLTENQYRALTLVEDGEPGLREFAVRLAMKPPNVTTLIDGLVGRKLIRRERDPRDGRRIALHLTAAGRTLLARADAQAEKALAQVASFDEAREHALLSRIDDWQLALDGVAADLRDTLDDRPRTRAST